MTIRMNKYLILIILLLGFSESYSQVNVSVGDTTIPQGDIYDIPVNVIIPEAIYSDIESCSIKFVYDARIINIQDVTAGAGYLMQCEKPTFINNYDDLQLSILSISCNDCQLINDGLLCTISIQGLVGPDSLTSFATVEMSINGEIVEDLQSLPTTIKVPGTIISQEFPEGIGINFPNPCHYTTVFPFNINKISKVHFEIYNASGRLLLSSNDPNPDIFSVYFISKNGVEYIPDMDSELNQGSYFLRLYFSDYEISSGLYYLKMKTKNGTYNVSFMIIR